MIFCEVNETLASHILSRSRGGIIVDCGAGDGLLGSMLKGKVLGIDLFPGEDQFSLVVRQDAEVFPFQRGMLPVFLRPCHSGFVDRVIIKNIHMPLFLYVSKPENVEIDLPEVGVKYDVKLDHEWWAGNDGERVYAVVPIKDHEEAAMHTFCLVSNGFSKFWVEDTGDPKFYLNGSGGKFPKGKEPPIKIVTVDYDDMQKLDWTGTHYDVPTSNAGWLSPSGKWFGCRSTDHDGCAFFIIKKNVAELEKEGWVRVYGSPDDDVPWIKSEGRLTAEQRNWLSFHGHIVNDDD